MNDRPINIPKAIVDKLKQNLEQHKNDSPKPKGFTQVQGFVALEEMTTGQANKIKTFYSKYSPNADEDTQQMYNMYGGNLLRNFVNNQLQSRKTADQNSKIIKRHTDHPTGTGNGIQGRSVDRLNKPNKASTTPPTTTQIKPQLQEEIKKFNLLTNYDVSRGLI